MDKFLLKMQKLRNQINRRKIKIEQTRMRFAIKKSPRATNTGLTSWLQLILAKIDARTRGENQTPIHYAAKNNAIDALKVLIKLGADIGAKDYKNRTPLFVAAETGYMKWSAAQCYFRIRILFWN